MIPGTTQKPLHYARAFLLFTNQLQNNAELKLFSVVQYSQEMRERKTSKTAKGERKMKFTKVIGTEIRKAKLDDAKTYYRLIL